MHLLCLPYAYMPCLFYFFPHNFYCVLVSAFSSVRLETALGGSDVIWFPHRNSTDGQLCGGGTHCPLDVVICLLVMMGLADTRSAGL
jgi:hypothetical protein